MDYAPRERVVEHVRRLLGWNHEMLTPHLPGRRQERALVKKVEVAPGEIDPDSARELEAVVLERGRPVLFVHGNEFEEPKSREWQTRLTEHKAVIQRQLPSVGRIELRLQGSGHGQELHIGTGFVVGPNVLLTNRHVAEVCCTMQGDVLPGFNPQVDFAEEFKRDPDQEHRIVRAITIGRSLDFALLEILPAPGYHSPEPLDYARHKPPELQDGEEGTLIFVVGYPASDPELPPTLQARIFSGIFGVKRLAPGRVRTIQSELSSESNAPEIEMTADYTTLGGNSGSPLCDLQSGLVVGLHFAGAYFKANYAVPVWSISTYIEQAVAAVRTPKPYFVIGAASADPRTREGLSIDAVGLIQQHLHNEPDATLAYFRNIWDGEDGELSLGELRSALETLRMTAERGGGVANEAAIASAFGGGREEAAWPPAHWGMGKVSLPADFQFPGMIPEIPINPASCKFETRRDASGWMQQTSQAFLAEKFGWLQKERFRWAEDYAGHFVYPMAAPQDDGSVRIGLFSDFGTGLYHSRYVARHLIEFAPRLDYAFHLGDVYYKGTQEEFEAHFIQPLAPLVQQTRLFALNANHEMLSGGMPYFTAIDARRNGSGAAVQHEQEGSYFCVRGEQFQIIGIDTAYHSNGRHAERRLNDWLATQLERKRTHGTITILLSGNEPYARKSGERSDLLARDLQVFAEAGLIDLWFWGNEHYCALYSRMPEAPFVGSCIGHGGYPYTRVEWDDVAPSLRSRVKFLERRARFPESTGVRPDRGNNGFAILTLKPDASVQLDYYDWMRNVRFATALKKRDAAGGLDFME